MLNYKEKYLKYKAKYLQLKGGRITTLKNSLAVKDCLDKEKLSDPSTKNKCILFNNKLNTNNKSKYMSNKLFDWFGRHFSTIALVVAILNLALQNYIIGSLWVLIFLTEYQSKQNRK